MRVEVYRCMYINEWERAVKVVRATCRRQKQSFSCALRITGFANSHKIHTKKSCLVKLQFNKHETLLKNGLRHRCLPVNFVKFIRTAFKGHNQAIASAIAIVFQTFKILLAINDFCKKFHLRCLTEFWICLWDLLTERAFHNITYLLTHFTPMSHFYTP